MKKDTTIDMLMVEIKMRLTNFIFNKKPKIKFFSIIPEVAEVAPIVSAIKFKPNILKNSSEHLSQLKKSKSFGTKSIKHVAKCPGIFKYVQYGWVMVAYQDIYIKTNGDGTSFEWKTPMNQKELTNGKPVGDYLSFLSKEEYSTFTNGIHDSLNTLIKIQSPWRCIIPKGYYLHEGPMPYTDERRFTPVSGVFDRDDGVAQLNPFLQWHLLNGETVIKAGTPIAHYMLIPKEQAQLEVGEATKKELFAESVTQLAIFRRYVSKRSDNQCIFKKMFKNFES